MQLWRPIPGYPDYSLSSDGAVFSLTKNNLLKPGSKNRVRLYKNNKSVWINTSELIRAIFPELHQNENKIAASQ